MPKFVYVSAILPGKSETVRQVLSWKPALSQNSGLAESLGLEGSQAWIQCTPQKDYFVHCAETQELMQLFSRFQEQVEAKKPEAIWLRDFYLSTLGKDFGHHSAAPNLQNCLSLKIPGPIPAHIPVVSQGYAYPLLSDKTSQFLEFCRQAAGEYLVRFQEAYHQMHVRSLSYYLQKTPSQNFLIVYQEMLQPSQTPRIEDIQTSSTAVQWLAGSLQKLTGLEVNHLQPRLERLT